MGAARGGPATTVILDFERRLHASGVRRLVTTAAEHAGAVMLWLETSNQNVPGVRAYERLGFVLASFDLSLYDGTPAEESSPCSWPGR